MSTPQATTNPMTQHKTAPCAQCDYQLSVPPPTIHVLNGLESSVIVIPHENAIICGNCGSSYTLQINRANTNVSIDLKCVQKQVPRILSTNGLILPS